MDGRRQRMSQNSRPGHNPERLAPESVRLPAVASAAACANGGTVLLDYGEAPRVWHQWLLLARIAVTEFMVAPPDFELLAEDISLASADLDGLRAMPTGRAPPPSSRTTPSKAAPACCRFRWRRCGRMANAFRRSSVRGGASWSQGPSVPGPDGPPPQASCMAMWSWRTSARPGQSPRGGDLPPAPSGGVTSMTRDKHQE